MRASPDTPNGSQLCLECALCCDGSLFTNAQLQDHETDSARALGLTISTIGDKPTFHMGCPLLDGRACSIYEHPERPQVCGGFRCALLKRYLAGEVELQTGLDVVRTVRALLEDIQAQMPFGRDKRPTYRNIRLMVAYLSTLPESSREQHTAFLKLVTDYIRLIGREFVSVDESAKDAVNVNTFDAEAPVT